MSFEVVLLEDLAAPVKNSIVGGPFGSNLVSKDYVSDGVPVIRGQNMGDRWVSGEFAFVSPEKANALDPNKTRPGDLVFTQRGTLGQVSIVPSGVYSEYILSQSQMKVTPDPKKTDVHYLYYAFRSPDQLDYIRNTAIQTGVPHTNLGILKKTPIQLPPLAEQQRIAGTLGSLDDRITLLRETNTLLEQIAQTIFKSWFVDFDPVRAKQEGQMPEGMDEETAALFPDSFEESELGMVPRGWSAGKLSDLLTESTARVAGHEAMVLSAIQTGDLVPSEDHFNKRVHSADISKYKKVAPRAFAYNPSRINIGSIGLNEFDEVGAVSPIYVVANSLVSGYEYIVWHHLRRKQFKEHINTLASGTVRQSLSFRDFSSIPIVIPAALVVERFVELRSAIYSSFRTNSDTVQTLADLRDTLLPRLISGKLRLPEAEAMLSCTDALSPEHVK